MINLDKIPNNKKELNKQNLLKIITDLDIYRFYLDDEVNITTKINSPFRKDENPSFGFFTKNNEILFNDFVVGGGDCIRFVQKLFHLNFNDALTKIVYDFKINNNFIVGKNNTIPTIKKEIKTYTKDKDEIVKEEKKLLKVKLRNWKKHDKYYWESFGINLKTLKKYNVYAISHIFINDKIIKAEKYSYVYIEKKDKDLTYKIYQPFSLNLKWLSNIDYSVWQGWTQLPEKAEKLIITKSLKDIMCIDNNTKYCATGLQNEKIIPKNNIIRELRNRFDLIYILYDNDFDKKTNWGKIYSEKIAKEFNLIQVNIPSEYKCTDISEFFNLYGKEKTNKLLTSLIELPF